MKYLNILVVLIILFTNAKAADFNDKQKAIIYNEAIKMLKAYVDLNNQMADAVADIDEMNKASQKLVDLFVSRKSLIYNDLDPSFKMSEAFELETYITNLLLWYPDGMKISLDFEKLKAGNIIDHGEDIFTVDLMSSKINDGNFLNRQKNELKLDLVYRIAFFQKDKNFESFKIAGVRSSKSTLKPNNMQMLAEVKSVEFSEKEMDQIYSQTKSLMNDYINFINLLADPNETIEDKGYYKVSFFGLFKDSTLKVANDLEPDPQNRWISVSEYQKNLTSFYPEGIRNIGLNIDSASYGKVIPDKENKYYINGYIDKFFSGKYQNKTLFRDNAKYDFKVSFEKDENTFKNFKLANIDKFGVNLYDQDKTEATQELPQHAVTSFKRNGLYIGSSFSLGKTMLNDFNLENDPVLNWNIKNNATFSVEANAMWYFYNRWSVTSGLGYSRYSASVSLYGEYASSDYTKYQDTYDYYKVVTAQYDSLLNLNYLNIPLIATFQSNSQPDKWGIYAQLGLSTSINLNSNYSTTGDMENWFYNENDTQFPVLRTEDVDGYKNRKQINEQGNIKTQTVNFALITSVGITYPLDYFTSVFCGPELVWGLNNIATNKQFTDAFGNTSTDKKVKLSKFGIKFGINYKF